MYGDVFEYIEVEWDGKYLLQPGTVLCFSLKNEFSAGTGFDKWNILLNGTVSNDLFKIYDNVSSRFIEPNKWFSLYILKDFNSTSILDIYDGITFGISREDYSYDIPFQNEEHQLFFNEEQSSSFAYVPCHPSSEECELFEYYKDILNWISNYGDRENTLLIEDVCLEECPEDCEESDILAINNCSSNKMDFLFLLDRSGSIVNQGEFHELQEIVENVSSYLDCKSDDIRFAAASFAGTGSFAIIEDFQYDALDISYYNPPGGATNVYDAYKRLKLAIDNGVLVPRSDASFHLITISDAPSYNGNGLDPYQIYNTLKAEDYNIKNYIIHFKDDNTLVAEREAATASSKNGPFQGILDSNPGDPEGEGPPRHLYIYNSITSQITEAIESITACHLVEFSVPEEIEVENISFSTSNSGQILAEISDYVIETNGIGTYSLSITDVSGCVYTSVFEFDETDDCDGIINGPTDKEGKEEESLKENEETRHEKHEVSLKAGLRNNSKISAFLYPNPTSDILNIEISNDLSQIHIIEIYDTAGKKVKNLNVEKYKIEIDVAEYSSGLYTVLIKDINGQNIIKKFVISK